MKLGTKRLTLYLLTGLMPLIIMIFLILMYGLINGFVISVAVALFFALISKRLSNSKLSFIEEKPRPFIMAISGGGGCNVYPINIDTNKKMRFNLGGIERIFKFNRSNMLELKIKNQSAKVKKDGDKYTITLDKDKESFNSFYLGGIPFFIYSTDLNTIVNKDWLANQSQDNLILTNLFQQSFKIDELNNETKILSRRAVEMLKSNFRTAMKSWGWIIIVLIVVGVLLWLGLPYINQIIAGLSNPLGHPATSTVNQVVKNATKIAPKKVI